MGGACSLPASRVFAIGGDSSDWRSLPRPNDSIRRPPGRRWQQRRYGRAGADHHDPGSTEPARATPPQPWTWEGRGRLLPTCRLWRVNGGTVAGPQPAEAECIQPVGHPTPRRGPAARSDRLCRLLDTFKVSLAEHSGVRATLDEPAAG